MNLSSCTGSLAARSDTRADISLLIFHLFRWLRNSIPLRRLPRSSSSHASSISANGFILCRQWKREGLWEGMGGFEGIGGGVFLPLCLCQVTLSFTLSHSHSHFPSRTTSTSWWRVTAMHASCAPTCTRTCWWRGRRYVCHSITHLGPDWVWSRSWFPPFERWCKNRQFLSEVDL